MAFCPFELQKATVNQDCAGRKCAGKYIWPSSKVAPKYPFRRGSTELRTTGFPRRLEDQEEVKCIPESRKGPDKGIYPSAT